MQTKSLKFKLTIVLVISIVVSSFIGIMVSAIVINNQGKEDLEAKSKAILNRMEVVRDYIAKQGFLDETIRTTVLENADGNLSNSLKEKIMRQVPITASWNIGKENSSADNYKFRISSPSARNAANKSTTIEMEFIERFKKGETKTISYIDKSSNSLWVMKPVYLKESEGCLNCHGNPTASPYRNGKDILGYPMENWKDGDFRGMFMIISDLKPVQSTIISTILGISGINIVLGIIAFLISFFTISKIINYIRKINSITQKVAEGDLSQNIAINTNDELEELGNYINKMIASLKKMIEDIQRIASELTSASEEIAVGSNQISGGTQNQANQFEEISASIQKAAENSSHASIFASHIVQEANNAGNGLENVISSMNKIEGSSTEIYEILKLIREIAFQTNLLSLNAAVEAARAGTHGKGFAVVASEVRKLAEKSSTSTKQINEVIQNNIKQINDGADLTKQSVQQIKDIIEGINKINVSLQEISNAAKEQSQAMEKNNQVINNTASATEELAASADTLLAKAEDLNKLTHQFKT